MTGDARLRHRPTRHPVEGARMIFVLATGLLLIALALPVASDGPPLTDPGVRRWLWRFGVALSAFAIVVGDYEAGGVATLAVMIVLCVTAIGCLFWLDRGRFDSDYTRRSMGWYFRECGPGGWPMGGHRIMAVVTVAILLALLLLRPVARMILGLDAPAEAAVLFI